MWPAPTLSRMTGALCARRETYPEAVERLQRQLTVGLIFLEVHDSKMTRDELDVVISAHEAAGDSLIAAALRDIRSQFDEVPHLGLRAFATSRVHEAERMLSLVPSSI